MNLSNKIAVVTGVSKGIGAALCQQLLEEGAKVFGLGRNAYPETHPNFTFIPTDVRNYEAVEKAFHQICTSTNHQIDVLINNAGILHNNRLNAVGPISKAW